MKSAILLLSPILISKIYRKLGERYTVRPYHEQADQDTCVAGFGGAIRGVVTGGHAGITRVLMETGLKMAAVNGVGTDAVDLAYTRERGIHVTAAVGALIDHVADLAIGLLFVACRGLCTGDRYVREGQWGKSGLPLGGRFSGMRVGIVGLGRIAGARLDVFVDEPNVPVALRAMDSVALQPHRASATLETRTAMGEMVLWSPAQRLSGQRPELSVTTWPGPT